MFIDILIEEFGLLKTAVGISGALVILIILVVAIYPGYKKEKERSTQSTYPLSDSLSKSVNILLKRLMDDSLLERYKRGEILVEKDIRDLKGLVSENMNTEEFEDLSYHYEPLLKKAISYIGNNKNSSSKVSKEKRAKVVNLLKLLKEDIQAINVGFAGEKDEMDKALDYVESYRTYMNRTKSVKKEWDL